MTHDTDLGKFVVFTEIYTFFYHFSRFFNAFLHAWTYPASNSRAPTQLLIAEGADMSATNKSGDTIEDSFVYWESYSSPEACWCAMVAELRRLNP